MQEQRNEVSVESETKVELFCMEPKKDSEGIDCKLTTVNLLVIDRNLIGRGAKTLN